MSGDHGVLTSSPARRKPWVLLRTGHPVLSGYTAALLVLLPALLIAFSIDERTLLERNIWLKPIKFDLAIAFYLITLSLYAHLLPPSWRNSPRFNRYVAFVCVTVIIEMAWLIYAAAIGEVSHFNQSHPVLAPVYFIMGLLAILLTSLSAVIGVGVLRHHEHSANPLIRYAVGYSLLVTAVLTVLTAGYLSSAPAQSHAVLPAGLSTLDRQSTIPLFGWLREAGDLRVAHFFAMHALHAVPLAAVIGVLALPRAWTTHVPFARVAAIGLCTVYTAFVVFVFTQALAGKPFL